MMDVISARNSSENTEEKLSNIQNKIQLLINSVPNENQRDWTSVKSELKHVEFEILSGDWGGYYEAYRRPLMARVDNLIEMMGQIPPERPSYVFTQSRNDFFLSQTMNGSAIPSHVLQNIMRQQEERQKINAYTLMKKNTNVPLFKDVTLKSIEQETCSI